MRLDDSKTMYGAAFSGDFHSRNTVAASTSSKLHVNATYKL